jgi:hypothetical protein
MKYFVPDKGFMDEESMTLEDFEKVEQYRRGLPQTPERAAGKSAPIKWLFVPSKGYVNKEAVTPEDLEEAEQYRLKLAQSTEAARERLDLQVRRAKPGTS